MQEHDVVDLGCDLRVVVHERAHEVGPRDESDERARTVDDGEPVDLPVEHDPAAVSTRRSGEIVTAGAVIASPAVRAAAFASGCS